MGEKKKKQVWEGWKKEIKWMMLLIVVIAMALLYRSETIACKTMVKTECFQKCEFEGGIRAMEIRLQEDFPGATLQCDFETNSCKIFGSPKIPYYLRNFTTNITLLATDSIK